MGEAGLKRSSVTTEQVSRSGGSLDSRQVRKMSEQVRKEVRQVGNEAGFDRNETVHLCRSERWLDRLEDPRRARKDGAH